MTGQSPQTYGVLMGDLVQSEAQPSTDALHNAFNTAIADQNAAHRATIAAPLTITLGDEFQGMTHRLADLWPIARDLRYQLLAQGVDCRFALGLVHLKTPLNPDNAWNMMGPGLADTRQRLEAKKTNTLYRFALPGHPLEELLMEALGTSLTAIERAWTDQQRADIADLMLGATASELAAKRGVSVHSIYKVRASGDYDAYSQGWKAIATALADIDEREGLT